MSEIIDELIVTLGLDPSKFKKGQKDSKGALDQMRRDAADAQASLDAIQEKSARQSRKGASEERQLAAQIAAVKRNSTNETKAEDTKQVRSLEAKLASMRNSNRDQKAQDAEQIKSQKKILESKQKGIKDTEKGEKEALNQSKKRTEGTRNEATAVAELTTRLIGLFAAFTLGKDVGSFITDTTKSAAALGMLADNLGLPIEKLSAFEGAFDQLAGVSAKDADAALQTMVDFREKLKLGQVDKDQAKFMNSLGMRKEDFDDPIEALKKIAEYKKSHNMSDAQFSILGKGVGLTQPAINALELGRDKLQALEDAARKAGVTTQDLSDQSKKLYADWANLDRAGVMLGQHLLVKLDPLFQSLTDKFKSLVEWMDKHPDALNDALIAIGVSAGAALAVMFPLTSAIAAVAAGITWLTADFAEFGETGKSAIDWAPFIPAWNHLKTAIGGVVGEIVSVNNAIDNLTGENPDQEVDKMTDAWKNFGSNLEDYVLGVIEKMAATFRGIKEYIEAIKALVRGDWGKSKDWMKKGDDDIEFNNVDKAIAADKAAPATHWVVDDKAKKTGHWEGKASGTWNDQNIVPYEHGKNVGWHNSAHTGAVAQKAPPAESGGTSGGTGGNTGGGSGGGTISTSGGSIPYANLLRAEGGMDRNGRFRTSSKGAYGPAQLMPGTMAEAARLAGVSVNAVKTDAAANIAAGNAYYNHLRAMFGNDAMAAAAYNAGPGNVRKAVRRATAAGNAGAWSHFLPGETKGYLAKVGAGSGGGMPSYEPPYRGGAGGGAVRSTGGARGSVSSDVSSLLMQAAQALLSAALALRGAGQAAGQRRYAPPYNAGHFNVPQSYDRGMNVGASAGYAHHVITNDNSQRVESSTQIGQIHIQAGNNADAIARGLELSLRNRMMAYNAAQGLY